MSEHRTRNQSLPIVDVKDQLHSLIDRVARKETRVVVEQDGTPVAAIVSLADLKRLDRLDRERAERAAVLEAMRAPFRDVPPEEIEQETERILARIRAERQAEREQVATVNG